MAHTITIDVYDKAVPEGNHRNIPVIDQPNPAVGFAADAKQVRALIQLPTLYVYASGTNKAINGSNYFDYFPEENPWGGGGGGGGVTPAQVQAMIANSIDATVSASSTNAIQNKSIKSYVDSGLSGKANANSLATVATSGAYSDLTGKPTTDSSMSDSSENAVQNKVIKGYVDGITGDINSVLEGVL